MIGPGFGMAVGAMMVRLVLVILVAVALVAGGIGIAIGRLHA